VFRNFDNSPVVYDKEDFSDSADVIKWLMTQSLPKVMEFREDYAVLVMKKGLTSVILFMEDSDLETPWY
jgi:Thioredoxin-like domain